MKNRITIGTSSILFIFILLCLSVFSLLSLSDGKSALTFARQRAEAVSAYYSADQAGQSFLNRFFTTLSEGGSVQEALAQAKDTLPEGSESGFRSPQIPYCEIPMPAGQALYIELDPETAAARIYCIYNKEDYAIDDSLPVWGSNTQ